MAVMILAAGLAGCSSSGPTLGENTGPGQSTQLATPGGVAQPKLARISVAPVIGAPETVSRDMQAQLTGALERRGITVTKASGEKSEYTLRGYIVAARERSNVKVSYIWDVTDQTSRRVNRITGEESAPANAGKDPWSAIGAPMVATIADRTAGSMSTWMATQSAGVPIASAQPTAGLQSPTSSSTTPPSAGYPVAAASPMQTASTTGSIERGPFSTVVPPVTGAPGDGTQSLTQAIQRELMRNGVPMTEQRTAAAYRVEGKVLVGAGRDGKQPIQIDWNVIDPSGKKVGTVSQKNEIPQGSLDGAWGKTADAAASAAAQGIIKLLPKTN